MNHQIIFPSTEWKWGRITVQVALRRGTNTIEFYGGYPSREDYALDIAEILVF
jgi:hypothetical protein